MASKFNITIDQGSTFSESFNMADANGTIIDLSPYTGTAQLRKHYTSSNSTAFSVSLASNGELTISMTSNTTANIVAGRYVYDIEIMDSSNAIYRVIEGIATVTPNVTR